MPKMEKEKSLSMKMGGLAEGARERERLSIPKGGWDKGKAMGNPQGMWPEKAGEIVIRGNAKEKEKRVFGCPLLKLLHLLPSPYRLAVPF